MNILVAMEGQYMTEGATYSTEGSDSARGAAMFARGLSAYESFGRPDPRNPLSRLPKEGADGTAYDWSSVTDKLLSMYSLEDDWDGNGAVKPTPMDIRVSLQIVATLRSIYVRPPDRTVAGVNGSVVMEWFTTRGYFKLEADEGGAILRDLPNVLKRTHSD